MVQRCAKHLYGYGEDSDHMVWDAYIISDQSWIAADKAGEKSGKIFERQFDRPPTVKLKSDTSWAYSS